MRKKILFIFAALTLAGSLVACGEANSQQKETKNTITVEGDGSLIPKSVKIDDIEYKKNSTLGEFIDNGWTVRGYRTYKGTETTDETSFTLEKPDCLIVVTTFSEETKTIVKDKRICNISVTNQLENNNTKCEASNGLKLGMSSTAIDSIYRSVSDKIHKTVYDEIRVGTKKYASTIYKDSEGTVSYGFFIEDNDDTIYSISVVWYK